MVPRDSPPGRLSLSLLRIPQLPERDNCGLCVYAGAEAKIDFDTHLPAVGIAYHHGPGFRLSMRFASLILGWQ